MNRKAFTLVELLAAITILVVIISISVPQLINSISNKKNDALNKVYDLVESVARNYVIDYNIEKPTKIEIEELCGRYMDCPVINPKTEEELNGYVFVGDSYYYIDPNEISLTVELNGGTSGQTFASRYETAETIHLIEPIKDNSDFKGWEIVKGNSLIKGNELIIGGTDTIVHARWENWPTFTIELNDSTTTQEFDDAYKSGTTFELINPTKEGYKFMGWIVTEGNSIISGSNFTMGSENTTLTANFVPLVIQAIYSETDNSLTFINDRAYTVGETYNGNVVTAVYSGFENRSYNDNGIPWKTYKSSIKKVEFIDEITPVSITSWFKDMTNCENMDLTNLNTTRVTNMDYLFYNTGSNSTEFTLDLGDSFDTSNVTSMGCMFSQTGRNSANFTLDLGDHFDTSNVTGMYEMFSNTGSNSPNFKLDLGDKFDTSNVTSMARMFQGTGSNSVNFTLDLGDKFDTSNVTNMIYMFQNTGRSNTEFTLDLGNKFNTSNVTNMSYMFKETGYSSTEFTLDLGEKFNTINVTTMYEMFGNTGVNSTKFTLDLGDEFDTRNVKNMGSMFGGTGSKCTKFTLDLGEKFNTINVTNMDGMFSNTGSSSTEFTLDLGDYFDTRSVKSMGSMFASTGSNSPNFKLDLGDKFDTSIVENMGAMFMGTGSNSPNFTLDLGDNFNTSSVTNMSRMFQDTGRNSVNFTLDLGNKFDTSNVTNMLRMFQGTGLNNVKFSLDLGSEFKFKDGVNVSYFVSSCNAIKLIIPETVTYIPSGTFSGMTKLTEIVFEHSASSAITLPTAGSSTGAFYVSPNKATTVTTINETIKNYDWASDNRTVTFN